MLEGVELPPGITNFLLPNAVAGPCLDSGLMPLKLIDLLRQSPLSQSAINSGRMEMVFACGRAGVVRAQFWRLKAGADACGRSSRDGSRVLETTVSEQKRLQRRKDSQRYARESLKRIKSLLIVGNRVEGNRVVGIPLNNPLAAGDALVFSAEASAEQAVTEYAGRVAAQERAAEAAFWAECSGVCVPPDAYFEPWVDTKVFTAADCLRHSLEATSRHWFQASCEKWELEQVMGRRAERATAWAETLKRVSRIQQRFLRASFAWDTYVALSKENTHKENTHKEQMTGNDSAAAATEWLVAWIEATVGEAYLHPLMARSSPGAGPEPLRRELLLEIRGGVASLGADALPVPAFSLLPATVARGVRDLHTNGSDHFERLTPETQRRLLSLNAPRLDPLAALLGKEQAALLWERVQSLPPQQRRALDLAAAGVPRREMAAAMGCGEESVKEHLSRARHRLRAEFQRPG